MHVQKTHSKKKNNTYPFGSQPFVLHTIYSLSVKRVELIRMVPPAGTRLDQMY